MSTWAPWPGCSTCGGTGEVDAGGRVVDCPSCAMRAMWVAAAADRDRYREALEEIAADCDCERSGCGEGAHWASCSSLCGTAPARARKALEEER